MNLFFEIVKLIVELLIIILVSKNLLVPIIRKLGEKLKLKPHTIGNIAGIATSIPEFLTVTFSAVNGMLDTGIFNILSSNISNTIQYTISILLNKNVNLLKNRVIKINMILVLLTIIIPIIVWKLQIMDNIIIVPIFIILFYIFNKINIISHKGIENEKEVEERQFKNKKIYVYAIYILLIGIILYLVGNLLSSTLRNLCYIFNISEVVIGAALGVATSTPEFITFIESQRFHKNANKELGIIEASNNLLVSNTLNLFIIQSLSIVIIYFGE